MTPQAAATGITLRYREPTTAPRPALADHRRLRQVVLNLLSNAIKYNRPGGHVDISSIAGDAHLEVVVTDTGRGIRPEHLPRLFTPFDRLDAAANDVEGTGVGLALSHRLMTLMGGTLSAASTFGRGSTFTASIPYGVTVDPNSASASVMSPMMQDDGEAPRTVLYVEDNSSNVELMERLVGRRPAWTLLVAGRGALGLELAAAAQPDLVLLDLHLPDMDGIEVLRRCAAIRRQRTCPWW